MNPTHSIPLTLRAADSFPLLWVQKHRDKLHAADLRYAKTSADLLSIGAKSGRKRQAACWLRYYFRPGLDFERSAIFTSSSAQLALQLTLSVWIEGMHFLVTYLSTLNCDTKQSHD